MAAVSNEIYCLLIPLQKYRLLVPRSSVAEVIRYTAPKDGEDGSWVRGTVVWNSINIPVISVEDLCGMEVPEPAGRTRIAVLHPVGGNEIPPYGILAEGFPQMVRISREVLELDQSYSSPEDIPLICRVGLLQEQAFIPDLEWIEEQLPIVPADV
jgi:chemotaxis signal transduction protein